jgi:hypothetical protein
VSLSYRLVAMSRCAAELGAGQDLQQLGTYQDDRNSTQRAGIGSLTCSCALRANSQCTILKYEQHLAQSINLINF